jgi:hypothetical protein
MRHLLTSVLLLAGCGFGKAPTIKVGARCAKAGLTIEVEEGSPLDCGELLAASLEYRAEYEARFGRQDLSDYVVRFRAADVLSIPGYGGWNITGHTYDDVIDLAGGHADDLPHELNHVRMGPGHAGWCFDYEPWSEQVLGINQRNYLGCN